MRVSAAGVDPAEAIAVEIKLAHDAQAAADKEFSAEVDKATDRMRKAETNWLGPNSCATIKSEPDSKTLKLKKGQTGTFKARAEANKGGAPGTASWTLGAQQNATFSSHQRRWEPGVGELRGDQGQTRTVCLGDGQGDIEGGRG